MLKDKLATQVYRLSLNLNNDTFTLDGNSMYPTLRTGFKVKAIPVDIKEIVCGDVVIFFQKN